MAVKAIFLDKDGTLIDNVPNNVDPARIRLSPGAKAATRQFARQGYKLLVVSNQPAIAQQRFSMGALLLSFEHIESLLHPVALDGIVICPHDVQARCACRKPLPGMLVQAAIQHGIDLGSSWMIGDILDDIEAGQRAGCRTVLIDNGNETEWEMSALRTPHLVASNLLSAAKLINSR